MSITVSETEYCAIRELQAIEDALRCLNNICPENGKVITKDELYSVTSKLLEFSGRYYREIKTKGESL